MSDRKRDRIVSLVLFVAFFGVYLFGAASTIQGGDVSEFVLLGLEPGGIAHPPGYPLYTLIVMLFGVLPIDNLVLRISLSSVTLGALAVSLLFNCCRAAELEYRAALPAALFWGFSIPFWSVSGVAEVFALHAVCTLLLLQATLDSRFEGYKRGLLIGLAAGLGASNHHTIVLAAPIAVWGLIQAVREIEQPLMSALFRIGGITLCGLTLGLLPYLYLPLASPTEWSWAEIDSWSAFVDHFLRRQYGTFELVGGREPASSLSVTLWALTEQARGSLWFGAALGLAGFMLAIGRRETRWSGIALLLSWLLSGVLVFLLFRLALNPIAESIVARFLVMPMLLLAFGTAITLDRAAKASVDLVRPTGWWVAVVLLVATIGTLHLRQGSWNHRRGVDRFVSDSVGEAPKKAVIFGGGDALLASMELAQRHTTGRSDVLYVDLHMLRRRAYYNRIKRRWPGLPMPFDPTLTRVSALFRSLSTSRPLCFVDRLALFQRIPTWPRGTLICVGRKPLKQVFQLNMQLLEKRSIPPAPADPSWEPWFAELRPRYLRPLKSLRGPLKSAGQNRALKSVERLLERLSHQTYQ